MNPDAKIQRLLKQIANRDKEIHLLTKQIINLYPDNEKQHLIALISKGVKITDALEILSNYSG